MFPFLFLALALWPSSREVTSRLPNNALAVFILNRSSDFDDRFSPLLDPFSLPQDSPLAVVVLPEPIEWGVLLPLPESPFFLKPKDPSLGRAPLGRGLVAMGKPSFLARLQEAESLPWWTRLKTRLLLSSHEGVLLWSLNQQEPWHFGTIDVLPAPLTSPLPLIRLSLGNTSANQSQLIIDRLKKLFYGLNQSFFTDISRFKLPDGTVFPEIREKETNAFTFQVPDSRQIRCDSTDSPQHFTIFLHQKSLLTLHIFKTKLVFCF